MLNETRGKSPCIMSIKNKFGHYDLSSTVVSAVRKKIGNNGGSLCIPCVYNALVCVYWRFEAKLYIYIYILRPGHNNNMISTYRRRYRNRRINV